MSKKVRAVQCPDCPIIFYNPGKKEFRSHLKRQHNYKGARLKGAMKLHFIGKEEAWTETN